MDTGTRQQGGGLRYIAQMSAARKDTVVDVSVPPPVRDVLEYMAAENRQQGDGLHIHVAWAQVSKKTGRAHIGLYCDRDSHGNAAVRAYVTAKPHYDDEGRVVTLTHVRARLLGGDAASRTPPSSPPSISTLERGTRTELARLRRGDYHSCSKLKRYFADITRDIRHYRAQRDGVPAPLPAQRPNYDGGDASPPRARATAPSLKTRRQDRKRGRGKDAREERVHFALTAAPRATAVRVAALPPTDGNAAPWTDDKWLGPWAGVSDRDWRRPARPERPPATPARDSSLMHTSHVTSTTTLQTLAACCDNSCVARSAEQAGTVASASSHVPHGQQEKFIAWCSASPCSPLNSAPDTVRLWFSGSDPHDVLHRRDYDSIAGFWAAVRRATLRSLAVVTGVPLPHSAVDVCISGWAFEAPTGTVARFHCALVSEICHGGGEVRAADCLRAPSPASTGGTECVTRHVDRDLQLAWRIESGTWQCTTVVPERHSTEDAECDTDTPPVASSVCGIVAWSLALAWCHSDARRCKLGALALRELELSASHRGVHVLVLQKASSMDILTRMETGIHQGLWSWLSRNGFRRVKHPRFSAAMLVSAAPRSRPSRPRPDDQQQQTWELDSSEDDAAIRSSDDESASHSVTVILNRATKSSVFGLRDLASVPVQSLRIHQGGADDCDAVAASRMAERIDALRS